MFKILIFLFMIYFIWSCSTNQVSEENGQTQFDQLTVLEALPEKVIFPPDNLYSEDKAKLGKILFYDPILSGNKDVACASCHHPDFGYAEFLDISLGVNAQGLSSSRSFNTPNDIPFLKRNSQSILNTAFNGITTEQNEEHFDAPMFWDLRVSTLEKQALEPIKAFEEMRGHGFEEKNVLQEIIQRLKNNVEYKALFKKVFNEKEPIMEQNLAKAIATFERTLVSNNSRFDQYMRGDNSVLSENELEGLQIFLKAGCTKCHKGPMFSDFKVHTLGVGDNEKLPVVDKGFNNQFQFRTPSLRNLRFTAPYMHNGTIKTLQNVLEFYEDLSGLKIQNPDIEASQVDPLLKHLKVNFKDISVIIEFLNTLNDDNYDKSIPKSVPSGLPVGGNIR
jgi:cytochrome c peroxidase